MKISKLPFSFYAFLFLSIVILACSKSGNSDNPGTNTNIYFGFNTKGSLNTSDQVVQTDAFLGEMSSGLRKNLIIRVTGGTLSQTTYPNDWTSQMIEQWVQLQQKHNFKMIYVVNGNDSPTSQYGFIQKWIDHGAKFEFLEMLNETYLPKYLSGDTHNHPEVTEAITPEQYVDAILPKFWKELDKFHLPYYVCLARKNPISPPQQASIENWNKVVISAIKGKYLFRTLNVTLHLYTTAENQNFDYNQINEIRALLPAGIHIAITEAGVIDDSLSSEALGKLAVSHYERIFQHLQPGDYLLDQILYNSYPKDNTANLSSVYGITNKGQQILKFIQSGFRY